MPTFKEFLGIKPKAEKKAENPAGVKKELDQAEERDKKLEQAKKDFVVEKPKLERRLAEIPSKIKDLEQGVAEMKGPEMRKILDKEFELNSALSPIDSTDPNRRNEYEEWKRALYDSRAATQEMKADLGKRIDDYQKKIIGLEEEKRETENRIQRGY